MKKILTTAAPMATLAVPATVATSSAEARTVPNVRCMALDRAKSKLLRKGFGIREHGGGVFGIIVKSAWVVVYQRQHGDVVRLTAGRSC